MTTETQQRACEKPSEIFTFVPTTSTLPEGKAQIANIQHHSSALMSGRLPSLEKLFDQLVLEWHRDTEFLSALDDIVLHPSYQRIIGLGDRALPLILGRLREGVYHWDWALRSITGQNPVPEPDEGDLERTREAWLGWAGRFGIKIPTPRP